MHDAYTAEECEQYLKNNDTYIHYKGEYIPRDKFLDTWANVVKHAQDLIRAADQETAAAQTRDPTTNTPLNTEIPTPVIHINQEGEYFAKEGGKWYEDELSYLGGTPILGDHTIAAPTDLDPTPPAKWGEGFKSNKRTEYPLPDEYTLDDTSPTPEHTG